MISMIQKTISLDNIFYNSPVIIQSSIDTLVIHSVHKLYKSYINFMLQLSDGRLVYFVRITDIPYSHYIVIINVITGETIVINETAHIYSIVELKDYTNKIAVCKSNEQVTIYDITNGSCDSVLIHPEGSQIRSLLVLSDGRLLTVDYFKGLLYIWDINTKICLRTLSASLDISSPNNYCQYPIESPDGSLAVVVQHNHPGPPNSFIRVWNRRLS
mmetsp:Transcript_6634/g.5948  ORF Transcript_6634/g.5948 Transcript_6634/m.5948 type:complete len:215 (+) Transcript_6634:345-989(+)